MALAVLRLDGLCHSDRLIAARADISPGRELFYCDLASPSHFQAASRLWAPETEAAEAGHLTSTSSTSRGRGGPPCVTEPPPLVSDQGSQRNLDDKSAISVERSWTRK